MCSAPVLTSPCGFFAEVYGSTALVRPFLCAGIACEHAAACCHFPVCILVYVSNAVARISGYGHRCAVGR
jgi:hypothetical protein